MLSLCSKEKRYGIDASYHEPLPNCQISASQKRTTFLSIYPDNKIHFDTSTSLMILQHFHPPQSAIFILSIRNPNSNHSQTSITKSIGVSSIYNHGWMDISCWRMLDHFVDTIDLLRRNRSS